MKAYNGALPALGIFRDSFLKEVIFELMLEVWLEITKIYGRKFRGTLKMEQNV